MEATTSRNPRATQWPDPRRVAVGVLEGFTIGVTAERRWAEQAALLARRGAVVLHAPTITASALRSDDGLRLATEELVVRPPKWLVASTGVGIRSWFEAAQAWGRAEALVGALAGTRVVARGPKAAGAVQAAGLSVWQRAPDERLDGVLEVLGAAGVAGARVAVQLHGRPAPGFSTALVAMGAEVVELPVYEWQVPAEEAPALRLIKAVLAGRVAAVTFTAAPAALNLVAMAGRHGLSGPLLAAFDHGVVAACVGPVCAEGARAAGIAEPIAPEVGRLGLLVRQLSDKLRHDRPIIQAAGHRVILQGRLALVDGQAYPLGWRERHVLAALAGRPGAVLSRRQLLKQVWGDVGRDPHVVESAVARLRRQLGPAAPVVETSARRGYRLAVPA